MRRKNKIENIKYQYAKVSKPIVQQPELPIQQPPLQKYNKQHQKPTESPIQNVSKEKVPTPIHAPRNFKYLNTFQRIQASLHELLSRPESVIPIELLHNNPELQKIVGTAYIVEQRKANDQPNISRFDSKRNIVIGETRQRSPAIQSSYDGRRKQTAMNRPYDEFSNIKIPDRMAESQTAQSTGSFQFLSEGRNTRSQFF